MSKKHRKGKKETDATTAKPAAEPAWQGYAGAGARTLIGLVFLVSGLHKAAAPVEEFAVVIEAYRLVSSGAAMTLARVIPWAEIFLGLTLIGGFIPRKAAGAAGAFFLLFIGVLASTLLRGIPLENCGCFGGGIHLTPPQAIGLDSFLLCLSYLAYKKGAALAPIESWIRGGKKETVHG